MVHPNQEMAVIAGHGTIALEVLEQVREKQGPAQPRGSAPHRQENGRRYPRCQSAQRFPLHRPLR